MSGSRYRVQSEKYNTIRYSLTTVNCELRTQNSGFTYVALLVAIAILGISMGAAGKYWSSVLQREKEEELLFRGEQYRLAIERYYSAKIPNAFPQNIDDLLTDNRTATGRRHLRKKYKDPITGEDFEVFRDLTKGNRITGVYSKSEREPLKKTGFPDISPIYSDFEGKMKYNEWKFLYAPQQGPVTRATGTKGRP